MHMRTIRFIYHTSIHGSIMAGIDNAGIAIAIAITAIFLGIAASLGATQDAGPTVSAPTVTKTVEPEMKKK